MALTARNKSRLDMSDGYQLLTAQIIGPEGHIMNDIDKAVADYLTAREITFEASYIGANPSPHGAGGVSDEFITKFRRESSGKGSPEVRAPFWQGIGSRELSRELDSVEGYTICKQIWNNGRAYCVLTPTAASVLYCLFSDASLGEQTFDDFCSNLGYDTDSRKAFDSYLECQAMHSKLRGFFSYEEREHLEELLEDY